MLIPFNLSNIPVSLLLKLIVAGLIIAYIMFMQHDISNKRIEILNLKNDIDKKNTIINQLTVDLDHQKQQFQQVEQNIKQQQQKTSNKIKIIEQHQVLPDCDNSIKYLKEQSESITWEQ